MLPLGDITFFVHSVLTALKCNNIDHVVVSSDSGIILNQARKYGAEGLERPLELCGDDIPNFAVCRHFVESFQARGQHIDTVVLLQPTHPFRQPLDLDYAIDEFLTCTDFDSLVSVRPVHRLTGKIADKMWNPMQVQKGERAQAKEIMHEITGHLFVLDVNRTIMRDSLLGERIYAWQLPDTWLDIDIDTDIDFVMAEAVASCKYHDLGVLKKRIKSLKP